MSHYARAILVRGVTDGVIVSDVTTAPHIYSRVLVRSGACGLIRSEDCLPDRNDRTSSIENIIVYAWFGAIAIVSIIGLWMALKNKSPRIVLAVVSFPGFATQLFLAGLGIHAAHMRSSAHVSDYLTSAFLLPLAISIFAFLGMPLISFFVMIGVIIVFLPPKPGPIRWTPVTATLLALTILSYAVSAYVNFFVNFPY